MKKKHSFATAIGLLTLGAACATSSAGKSGTPAIENVAWRLIALGDRAVPETGRAPRLQLRSDDRKAVGSGGCNHIGGTYTLEGSSLRFGALIATKMFCAGVMEQEQAFLDALQATTGYRVEGNELVLLGSGGVVARFRSDPSTQELPGGW